MKKVIVIFGKFVIFIIVLVLIGKVLDYVLVDDSGDDFRGKMLNFYAQDNIDSIFLGSSHVFCGINTDILEEKWNEDVYLASTSVQKPDVSYYLLKEAIKHYDVKRVFLEMYYHQYRDTPKERTSEQLKYIFCVSDYLNWSIDKVEFLWNACPIDSMLRAFVPAIRYGDNLFDLEYLDRVIKSKNNDDYRNPNIDKTDKGYRGGDINGEYTKSGNGNFVSLYEIGGMPEIDNPPISDYSLEYINKIIDLCKEKDIELILFTTPMTEFRIKVLGNYDSYNQYVKELAQKNKIQFFDFNLYNPQFGEFVDEMHSDDHHLNAMGAYYFSDIFGDVISEYKNGSDQSNKFCNTVAEKQQLEDSRFYGVKLEESGANYHIVPIQNTSKHIENSYRVFVIKESLDDVDEKYEVSVVDNKFKVEEKGVFRIEVDTLDFRGVNHITSVFQKND